MSSVNHLASRHIHAKRLDKLGILVQLWCQQTLFVYKSAKYKHIHRLKHKYCYSLSQTLDITYGTFI